MVYPPASKRGSTGRDMFSRPQGNPLECHHTRGGNPWRNFVLRLRSPGPPPPLRIPPGTGGESEFMYPGRPLPTRTRYYYMNDFSVQILVLLLWMRHPPLAIHTTPLWRKPFCPQGRPHLSEGLRVDAIRRWWRSCHISKPPFTVHPSTTYLPRGGAFHIKGKVWVKTHFYLVLLRWQRKSFTWLHIAVSLLLILTPNQP